jgi:hypothetical protein
MKRDITRSAIPLQEGQSAGSRIWLTGRISSNRLLHFVQTYSYIGIVSLHIQV